MGPWRASFFPLARRASPIMSQTAAAWHALHYHLQTTPLNSVTDGGESILDLVMHWIEKQPSLGNYRTFQNALLKPTLA